MIKSGHVNSSCSLLVTHIQNLEFQMVPFAHKSCKSPKTTAYPESNFFITDGLCLVLLMFVLSVPSTQPTSMTYCNKLIKIAVICPNFTAMVSPYNCWISMLVNTKLLAIVWWELMKESRGLSKETGSPQVQLS
jgi:hypothetical protein